jgi:hypothetical protein
MKPNLGRPVARRETKQKEADMKGRLMVIGLVLVVSALLLSGCGLAAKAESAPTEPTMSEDEARAIAANSECAQIGTLEDNAFYSGSTGTWWIELAADKPNCNPACVVHVSDRTAEVNWRCTGLITPAGTPAGTDTVPVLDAAHARDIVLDHLREANGDQAPAADLNWAEENVTPKGLVGGTTLRYTARDWVVTVSFPIVLPADIIYRVTVSNATPGFQWDGQVDAQGQFLAPAPATRG